MEFYHCGLSMDCLIVYWVLVYSILILNHVLLQVYTHSSSPLRNNGNIPISKSILSLSLDTLDSLKSKLLDN